jgi:hypothetical protein
MSRPANPFDNARCEGFIKTLKQEEIYCHQYRDLEDLRLHIREFIEECYNRCRLHSVLGYRSPVEFEAAMQVGATAAAPAASVKMSFQGMGRSIKPMSEEIKTESREAVAAKAGARRAPGSSSR